MATGLNEVTHANPIHHSSRRDLCRRYRQVGTQSERGSGTDELHDEPARTDGMERHLGR